MHNTHSTITQRFQRSRRFLITWSRWANEKSWNRIFVLSKLRYKLRYKLRFIGFCYFYFARLNCKLICIIQFRIYTCKIEITKINKCVYLHVFGLLMPHHFYYEAKKETVKISTRSLLFHSMNCIQRQRYTGTAP